MGRMVKALHPNYGRGPFEKMMEVCLTVCKMTKYDKKKTCSLEEVRCVHEGVVYTRRGVAGVCAQRGPQAPPVVYVCVRGHVCELRSRGRGVYGEGCGWGVGTARATSTCGGCVCARAWCTRGRVWVGCAHSAGHRLHLWCMCVCVGMFASCVDEGAVDTCAHSAGHRLHLWCMCVCAC
jgi:hypothetical protein